MLTLFLFFLSQIMWKIDQINKEKSLKRPAGGGGHLRVANYKGRFLLKYFSISVGDIIWVGNANDMTCKNISYGPWAPMKNKLRRNWKDKNITKRPCKINFNYLNLLKTVEDVSHNTIELPYVGSGSQKQWRLHQWGYNTSSQLNHLYYFQNISLQVTWIKNEK